MATMTGKLLRIDLTRRESRAEEIPLRHYRAFLSARGLGVKYLFDELSEGTDPLSPQNKLIFGIGILGGTRLQGFSKWSLVTKSPLTGTVMRSVAGGNFGVWLKWAGYDQLIVEGKAERPSYVFIGPGGATIHDAGFLAGLDPRTVQERLKALHGERTETACIGRTSRPSRSMFPLRRRRATTTPPSRPLREPRSRCSGTIPGGRPSTPSGPPTSPPAS
jgi:aldehyde:ferredoxin oxidoreductase